MTEKYWIGSNGEEPERMYFNGADALNSEHRYLDSFDADGRHVTAYKLSGDRYVTNF